ncbi:MAG: N-acetylneuraminate synthase family protein [Cyclobacteriaceae bacterium]
MNNPSSAKKIEIIAEVGQAHDGSLGIAHSYIDVLAGLGVDAVKFQTHVAEAESSIHEPFRVKFSYEDDTRFEYWKRMEFTLPQWKGLKDHCEQVGLEFISSPFSLAAVDILEEVGVKRYKVGSGETSNLLLLQKIAETGKPIILSSGMSAFQELKQTVDFLAPFGNPLSLLQCTTAYPTKPEQWGLNVLSELRKEFGLPIGFSDHSGDIFACIAAASLGAQILEFHVVFDHQMFGPDAPASLVPSQIKQLVAGVRDIEKSFGNPVDKNSIQDFSPLRAMFGKTLAINKPLKKGQVITFSDLESKKPANMGIPASAYRAVVGKMINKDMSAFSFLTSDDLE